MPVVLSLCTLGFNPNMYLELSMTMNIGFDGDVPHKQKWNSESEAVPENFDGCFNCNICLDSSHDPVVTLCGHLYCWACIYKWLQVQSSSFESDERPKCPVCKAGISTSSLVPLYGRGTRESEAKKPHLDLAIPQRPPAPGLNTLLATAAATSRTSRSGQQNRANLFDPDYEAFHSQPYIPHPLGGYISTMPPTFQGMTTTSFHSPMISMVGEMVFARIFGRSDMSLLSSPYSNSYLIPRNSSSRLRRQEMQMDKSLNRVSIFLFCCLILCLILF